MMTHQRGSLVEVGEHPSAFALAFAVIFLILFGALYLLGATPDASTSVGSTLAAQSSGTSTPTNLNSPEVPVRVVARDISLDVAVTNPATTDVDTLNEALTLGAVRYPSSALLGVDGTVLIFGHSSYLPVVYHQYYKTFDGIQNLKEGEMVSVYSSDTEYRYAVVGVKVVDANEDIINLPSDAMHLTLVTCDSFALKTNRFVVEADFVGAYALVQ